MDFATDMFVPDTHSGTRFKNVIRFAGVNWKPTIELASSFGLGGCPVGEGVSG